MAFPPPSVLKAQLNEVFCSGLGEAMPGAFLVCGECIPRCMGQFFGLLGKQAGFVKVTECYSILRSRKGVGVGKTKPASSPIRFAIFEVNLETGELRRHGKKLTLQEQPFQVLAALLEHPGQLVTRDELQHKVWASDTFVDFDRGINK